MKRLRRTRHRGQGMAGAGAGAESGGTHLDRSFADEDREEGEESEEERDEDDEEEEDSRFLCALRARADGRRTPPSVGGSSGDRATSPRSSARSV